MDIEQIEEDYRQFSKLKVSNPEMANTIILHTQKMLAIQGKIHHLCMASGEKGRVAFEAFKKTFAGGEYMRWRKVRAISMASCFEIYDLLNVKMEVGYCVGETFYLGVPVLTQKELDEARDDADDVPYKFIACNQKYGNDMVLHDVDEYGEFRPILDNNDLYGDGTGYTLKMMNEAK